MSDSLGDTTAAVSEAFAAASTDSPSVSGSESQTSSETVGATPSGSPAADQTQAASGVTSSQPGPIPYDRFHEVNTRMQTAESRAKEIEAQLREVQPLLTWRQQFQHDPIAAFGQLAEELQAHPELGQKFRSQAGRWLRGGGQPKPAEAPMPQPDLIDPSTGTRVYSAEQAAALMDWKTQQVLGQVQQQVAPLQEHVEQQRQEKVARQAWEGALTRASQTLGQWRQMPGFTEHEGQIKQLVQQGVDLGMAYAKVVVPTLSQRERQAVTQSLQAKTQATTMSPGYTPSAAASSPTYHDTHTAAREIARDVFASLS